MVNIDEKTLNKAKYGWSKYGGARHGLIKQGGRWYCQACGEEQPSIFPAYMLCVDNGEFRDFIRLCSACENIVKTKNIKNFLILKKRVTKTSIWKKYEQVFK